MNDCCGSSWPELVTSIAAVWIALAAWRASAEAIHATYRPVLRPVHLIVRATGFVSPAEFVLKNIGRGPAIGIKVFDYPTPKDAQPLGTLDVLDASSGETQQVIAQRGVISLSATVSFDPEPGTTYRVLYQDVGGHWHESHATYSANRIDATYLGQYRWWHAMLDRQRCIPEAARRSAHFVRPVEI